MAYASQNSSQGAFQNLSLISTQVAQPQWTSLELEKYSFAMSANQFDPQTNWVHHPLRDNLFAVFDSERVWISGSQCQERKLLKVIGGAEVLEHLNLNELVQSYLTAGGSSQMSHSQTSRLPVLGMHRSPCLAIRYVMQTGQTRRFQMRFKLQTDFDVAKDFLVSIGFPLKESLPPPEASTYSHQAQPISSSSTVRPGSSVLMTRPSTVSTSSTVGQAGGASNSGHVRPLSATAELHAFSSISLPPPISSRNSVSSGSIGAEGTSSSPLRHITDDLQTFTTNSQPQYPAVTATQRGLISHPIIPVANQIVTSEQSLSSQSPDGPRHCAVDATCPLALDPVCLSSQAYHTFRLPPLLPSPDLSRRPAFMDLYITSDTSAMPPPATRHSQPEVLASSLHHAMHVPNNIFEEGIHKSQRPASAPTTQLETLTQILPPKRDLPFGKAIGKISSFELPPLPTPTPVGKTKMATKRSTSPVASRKRKAPAKKKLAKKWASKLALSQPSLPDIESNGDTEEAAILQKDSRSGKLPVHTSADPTNITKSSEQTKQKWPLTDLKDAEDNVRKGSFDGIQKADPRQQAQLQTDASSSRITAVTTPPTSIGQTIDDVSTDHWDRIDAFVARHVNRIEATRSSFAQHVSQTEEERVADTENLAAYAAQSDQDRLVAIDDMICQNLMDDNFLQLCEDVENSWRRIGLGL
ncbi:MAG: hypothetical protein M1827_007611 [Pycnora praestabilis]|nr:MAG: hypothetical protein M1827_007611 [Pycnora praestabilis]